MASDEAGVDGETRRLLLSLQWLLDDEPCWNEKSEAWIERISSGPIDAARGARIHRLGARAAGGRRQARIQGLVETSGSVMPSCSVRRPRCRWTGSHSCSNCWAVSSRSLWRTCFPRSLPCRKAAKAARKILSSGMLELIDGEGLPNSQILDIFRPLMACWTRCRILGRHMEKVCASAKASYQYEWAIRAALRLSRTDGSQVFSRANGQRDGVSNG